MSEYIGKKYMNNNKVENKLRIGVDVRMLKSSGIGKDIENILARMILAKPDWDFFLLGRKAEIEDFTFCSSTNVHLIECDCSIYSICEQIVLPMKIPADLDCFWSPHYNIPVFYRGKILVTIHDLAHLALKDINKSMVKKAYANIMFRIATYKAKKIICVSHFTKSELLKYIPSVDKSKIVVVYNGVDEKWKNIKKEKSPYNKPYFVYVGNIKPHKNLHRLIVAYKMVADEIKQDLVLIGKKDGFITGDNNISELINGYENRIVFTGYVPDKLLMQYVVNADALVFPSLYEGFGLPPIEALAAGKNIIVSNIASLPEVCGEYATYFNPLDVMDIALKMKNFKKCKCEPNDEFWNRLSWNLNVDKLLDIIKS